MILTTHPLGRLLGTVLASISEFAQSLVVERTSADRERVSSLSWRPIDLNQIFGSSWEQAVFAARDRHCPRLHLLTRRNGDVANAASQPLCAIPEGHAGYAASAAGLYARGVVRRWSTLPKWAKAVTRARHYGEI